MLSRASNTDPDTTSKPSVPDAGPAKNNSTSSSSSTQQRTATPTLGQDEGFSWQEFFKSDLPQKLGVLLGLIILSRLGVYVRIPGVDVDAFADTMKNSGLLGYVDALSGGSISKVGLFSLGIIPYINASIVLQLLSAAFPGLKKLQREDGAQGRAKFQYYQKLAAFVFAIVQVCSHWAGSYRHHAWCAWYRTAAMHGMQAHAHASMSSCHGMTRQCLVHR